MLHSVVSFNDSPPLSPICRTKEVESETLEIGLFTSLPLSGSYGVHSVRPPLKDIAVVIDNIRLSYPPFHLECRPVIKGLTLRPFAPSVPDRLGEETAANTRPVPPPYQSSR